MPCEPSMNWVKKVTLKPTNTSVQPMRPQNSLNMRPVIFGHQWCSPPTIAISAEPIIT